MANNNYYSNNKGYKSNNKNYKKPDFSKHNNQGSNYKQMYVGAPYNFIPFNNKVVEVNNEEVLVHDKVSKDLLTGEINYTVTAKTDIMIDDGNGNFHKNAYGKYSIPGSTMRGLIRNNVQILGLSSFSEDIDDYKLMYRNVANGAEKDFYNKLLGSTPVSISSGSKPVGVLTNVRGGYIVKKNGKYYIYKTRIDKLSDTLNVMNYYVLSERDVVKKRENYPYLENHPEVMQHNIKKNFRKEEVGKKVHYKGEKNFAYKPGYYQVSYEVANVKNIIKLGEPGKFSNEGYLVATGPMNEKKALYVIPSIDMDKEKIEISQEDINSFKIDFENKKNTLKRFGKVDFFNLPSKENDFKPVFYIYNEKDNKLYFGFTPRIRLFYEHSVKEGYKQENCKFDYAKSIFGCIDDKTGYKSKVSFSDAKVISNYEIASAVSPVLASPKPTSYLDYIKQKNGISTYNTEGFELRGVKQYWLHNDLQHIEDSNNSKIASGFKPLKKGVKFSGKVRFQNLTEDELGLLLWSIRLNDNSWMNVGKAKSYGYGAITMSDITLSILDIEKAYSLDSNFNTNPMKEKDITMYINLYKDHINSKLNGKKIDEVESIKDFFIMKNSTIIPDNKDTRYMSLGDKNSDKEYQNRVSNKIPLRTVSEVINKK